MSETPRARQLAENFADLHPRYTADEALAEAARCLFCFDAPCTRSCPTHIDVPKFIRQILHKNAVGAAETILDANIFGGSCARACPTEVLCEGACVDNTLLKEPVRIGRLQRFACDTAAEKGISFFEAGPPTGKKVAVIGAGPAGLTCAHEMRKRGHAVTVFEARELAGGVNTYGIAYYKYDTVFALSEVDRVMQIGGIDLKLNSPVNGKNIAQMLKDYDAVFLGIGLGKTSALGIEGEDLPGVWEALDFIFQTHTKPLDECAIGRRVVVIGGGNTAVDVATAAVRLGAEHVTIAYRRTAEEMPAFAYEYELAKSDGIEWEFAAAPVKVVAENGKAAGVEFARTRLVGEGRGAKLETIAGANFTLRADMVIKALGQEPLAELLAELPGLKVEKGRVVVDRKTGATSVPKLFSGGDCTSKGAEVVDAVQEGKVGAAGIDALLAR
ncbi:MAG TPA: NAD(P)-dependent oxidoreductase [Phycisphaerae bacterium]|nr:NAD(P)-dependent oxidoreductase [Phycisphaerae bacterium]